MVEATSMCLAARVGSRVAVIAHSFCTALINPRPKTIASMTGTRDLQTVDIGVRLLHRPLMAELPWIYNNIGINYDEKILPSIGNEVLKSVVA